MRRGTTPTLTFSIPYEAEDIAILKLSFAQRGRIVLEKSKSQLTFEGYKASLKLSEAETLSFGSGQLKIQMRIGLYDGRVVSQIVTTKVEQILRDGALS